MSAGAEDIESDVLRIDLDLDLIDLGQNSHGRSRGMDPSPTLGGGNALDPVGTGFKFKPRVSPITLDHKGGFFDAADAGFRDVDHLGLPALVLSIAQIHPHQLRGEQSRFIAAGTGSDLDDDVFLIIRIGRDE